MSIRLYNAKDFEKMRIAGKLASEVLDYISDFIKPGVSTEKLNYLCHNFIIEHGATPAPLNYHGFPKSICTSINEVICHGIPSDKEILQEGDIVNIDVTVIKNGYYGDTSRMFKVGEVRKVAKKIVDTTYESLVRAIKVCKPGNTLADIGKVIQDYAESKKFSVVREFCGHGIGTIFHDEPNVVHYYNRKYEDIVLKPGMIFTIEPMINEGFFDAVIDENDGWTARTIDGKLSAQFEHTLGITKDGVEVFTYSNKLDTFKL